MLYTYCTVHYRPFLSNLLIPSCRCLVFARSCKKLQSGRQTPRWVEHGPFDWERCIYFLLNMGIFQPAILVSKVVYHLQFKISKSPRLSTMKFHPLGYSQKVCKWLLHGFHYTPPIYRLEPLHSLKLTARTRKWMVWRPVSFWDGLFSGSM